MLAHMTFMSTTGWLSAEMFARDDFSSPLGTFRSRSNAPRVSYVDDRPVPLRSVVLGGAGNSPVRQRRFDILFKAEIP